MKLTELNPRWCSSGIPAYGRRGMGVSFDCPHCRNTRLAVFFANPIDGQESDKTSKFLWVRTGESFDDLTLSPSIDASTKMPIPGHDEIVADGHWHGFIRNGNIE